MIPPDAPSPDDPSDPLPSTVAPACFKGTQDLCNFVFEKVLPKLDDISRLQPTDFEQALIATFQRISLLVRGVSELKEPMHFQIVAMANRTSFELLLDLKALVRESDAAAKFQAFGEVNKARQGKDLLEFLTKHPSLKSDVHQLQLDYSADTARQTRIDGIRATLWPTSKGKLKHWSGKTTRKLAEEAGPEYELRYLTDYSLDSNYVHASPVGIQGMNDEALTSVFVTRHLLIQEIFAEATVDICKEVHLFTGSPDLREELKLAAASTGRYLPD